MHPDRMIIADPETAPLPRVGRSRSMHHPTPPSVPPVPRRPRPESAQLTPISSPPDSPFANPPPPPNPTPSHLMLSRHHSLLSARERERDREPADGSPLGSLQKTLTSLQLRAQPKLDAARFKAEAGLTRRGFVRHAGGAPPWMRAEGEERLMDDADESDGASRDSASVDQDADADEPESPNPSRGRFGVGGKSIEERARLFREGGVDVAVVEDAERDRRKLVLERDGLKWPAGEGWAPL